MTSSLLIRSGRLVDPAVGGADATSEEPAARDLLVVDGRLVEVGNDLRAPSDVKVVDASGRFVLPGLVDAHVHLCFDPARHPEQWLADASDAEVEEVVHEAAVRTVRAGVTTVRDLGSRGYTLRRARKRIDAGERPGPRILSSGPVITEARGHCHFVGESPGTRDEAARTVLEHWNAGDEWIKIMVTGGALTRGSDPNRIQWGAEQVQHLVEVAGRLGLPVAAHVLSRAGARIAIEAGVTTVEHGVDLTPEDVDELVRRGQHLVPVLSPSLLLLASEAADPQHRAKLEAVVDVLHRSTRSAIDRGASILVGTDAGCPAVPHGISVLHEMHALERLGMSRTAVLRAATDLSALLGRTEPAAFSRGAAADFVLLDGDPRTDLSVMASPALVVARGAVVRTNTDS